MCFERDGRESVPGCYGNGVKLKDFCWDPERKSKKKKLKYIASDKPGCDESGYLFGKVLTKNGPTGFQTTRGDGRKETKRHSDGVVSVTIRPKGGSNDSKGRGASEWLGTSGAKCPK